MRKYLLLLSAFALLTGCNSFVSNAAKSIAAASAFVNDQAAQRASICQASPTDRTCVALARAGASINTAIDALEDYCGGPQFASGGACQEHAALKDKVSFALSNVTQDVADVKSLTGSK